MNDPQFRPFTKRQYRKGARPVTREDVRVYEAIVGRRSNISAGGPGSRSQAIHTFVIRAWPADMSQVSRRLREMCQLGIAHGVKKPQMAQWLRQMSDEAFKRLDEAHQRLASTRAAVISKRVEAREVPQNADSFQPYKRVA